MSTKKRKNRNQQKRPTKGKLNCLDDLDQIANEVDMICRLRLRDGAIKNGPLAGMESAIRQQTLIKVIGGFLQKSPDYIKGRKSDDEVAVHDSMEKCVAIAMSYIKAQFVVEQKRHLTRTTQIHENNGGSCQHPSLLHPSDWPTDLKARVVMIGVNRAVREGHLSAANAGIVNMVCVQGLRASEVARILGVKPPAISQQLRRVKKVLPDVMARVEVSWNS